MTAHLLPEMREVALLSSGKRIAKLQSDCWIGYSQAEKALEKLKNLLDHPKKIRMPNMLIIGPTNNGKTMIVEKFRRSHPSYEAKDGTHEIVPVLMIQMPTNPTLHRFYTAISVALGSPVTHYKASAIHEITVIKLMKTTQTKILIIDELHNILAGHCSNQREFLNILRFIGNELQISIVGVGIKDAYLAIRSDDQLENRFEPFILPLWNNDYEFIRLLASLEKILPLRKPSFYER